MTARPFLGLSGDDRNVIESIVERAVLAAAR